MDDNHYNYNVNVNDVDNQIIIMTYII